MPKLTEKEFSEYLSIHGTSKAADIAEEYKCSPSHVLNVSKRLHAAGVIGIQKLPITVKRKNGTQFTSNRLTAFHLIPPPKPAQAPKLTVEGSFDRAATQGELHFKTAKPDIDDIISALRKLTPEQIAEINALVRAERDWAQTVWTDLVEIFGAPDCAARMREGSLTQSDATAIEYLRKHVAPRKQFEREIAKWLRGFCTNYADDLAEIVEKGDYRSKEDV